MLKIKDNVELEELEKFGFEYDEKMKYWFKRCIGTWNKFLVMTIEDIDTVKGQIIFFNDGCFPTTLYMSTLYDLIKAGMVEKINE